MKQTILVCAVMCVAVPVVLVLAVCVATCGFIADEVGR